MKKLSAYLFGFILMFSLMFGFSGCEPKDQEQGLKVYTSFYTLYDFATKIAQDFAKVYNIMPAGADAHSWTPSPKDIVNLNKADMFIYNGLGMEHWTEQVVKTLDSNLLIVKVSEDIEVLGGDQARSEHNGHDHEAVDPHIWLSPKNAKVILENIKDAFVQIDPDNSEKYETNYNYHAELCDELDSQFQSGLEDFSRRDIVVTKNAFSYLCKEYNLTQTALGSPHETNPSAEKFAEIADFIKNNNVKVIFYEPMSQNFAQTLAMEASSKGAQVEIKVLNPLESLTQDDLKKGNDYFKIMRDNLDAIKYALNKQNG